LLVLLLALDAGAAAPPAELACLAEHYRLAPVFENGAWFAALPDGKRLPFDDGKKKTFDQRLDSPDIKDIFAIAYQTGAIRPVTDEDDDPGRVRVEAIFAATYGARGTAAEQVRVHFLGLPVTVHRKITPALARVAARIERARAADASLAPFLRRLSGGFANRTIAGTDRTSAHAFGIAIDLDKSMSDYWRWQRGEPSRRRWRNRIPQAIVDAFESEGFIWGGRWYHFDTMHFEYRPELFGPPCRPPVTSASDSPSH
jgi:D-alanyl-D-alanine carboxypeptidase